MKVLDSTPTGSDWEANAGPPAVGAYSCTAIAPGKVILFGEHAINRGQPAVAASVGLYSRCTASLEKGGARNEAAGKIHFHSQTHEASATVEELLKLRDRVEKWRSTLNFEAIRALKAEDFFSPQKYVLACAWGEALPGGLRLEWQSDVPPASGLGSGGSAFTAMIAAVTGLIQRTEEGKETLATQPGLADRAEWAHRGDIIAHGGIASALDTQTALLGGVIRYVGAGLAQPVNCARGLSLVIAHTGVGAPTSEVNTRVRLWLEEAPEARLKYFQAIGDVTNAGLMALERGDWPSVGRWMTLNQLVLEKIGVGCPEAARLIDIALESGAHGVKISGSGGGGIIIALVPQDLKAQVAEALTDATNRVFSPEIGVPGVSIAPTP